MRAYRRLARLLPFHTLADKLAGVTFCAIQLPLLAVLGWLLVQGTGVSSPVIWLLLLATLLACALALWAVHQLLAPLRQAQRALEVHRSEGRVLPVPTDVDDDMGELLRDLRRSLEHMHEERARADRLNPIDRLTGLPNRRGAENYLAMAAAVVERSGARLTIVLMDVDRFRELNDTQGCDVGDQALQATAEFLRLWLKRRSDWVGRWGGDEFIGILLTDQPSAAEYLGNLRREFGRQMRGFGSDRLRPSLSLSLGMSELRKHEDVHACLERAQAELDESRRARRSTPPVEGVRLPRPDVGAAPLDRPAAQAAA